MFAYPADGPVVQAAGRSRARSHARIDAASVEPLGQPVKARRPGGLAGWRSVGATPAGGEIAFWQPKR